MFLSICGTVCVLDLYVLYFNLLRVLLQNTVNFIQEQFHPALFVTETADITSCLGVFAVM